MRFTSARLFVNAVSVVRDGTLDTHRDLCRFHAEHPVHAAKAFEIHATFDGGGDFFAVCFCRPFGDAAGGGSDQ